MVEKAIKKIGFYPLKTKGTLDTTIFGKKDDD